MLVLTRKLGETVTIGNNIKVTVVDVKGKQVRLGIKAPADTEIHREEIYEKIQEESKLAAIGTSVDMDEILNLLKKNKK